MAHVRPNVNEARSKIVATVGPACHELETLTEVVRELTRNAQDAAAKQAKEDNLPAPDKPVPNKSNPGKRFILDGLLE